ncbi:hypothetical protein [Ruminococcus flavefaciens]|uniref:Uncharacterized protein n=1 Tax=Ruminococcus flavefaciens 007c TaxID=1341157 RepID=W7UML9_RUMFL|nr:hypothetical protein [Ruminococcus flavefaciens]EWM55068.1 hypothetical protein RF007C_05190 [Ruminococcus flavefaciens 007c]
MKKNDLRDALSGIKKDFIAESDDFKTISADFRREKTMKNKIVISAFCLVFVGIGTFGVFNSGLLKKDVLTAENEIDSTIPTVSNTSDRSDEPATSVSATNQQATNAETSTPHATENGESVTADNRTHKVIWAEDMATVNLIDDEGFTKWHQFNSVGYRLYNALESGEEDDVFAILARPAVDYTFIYNGKTLEEYDSDMYNEHILPDQLEQLLKEGDSLKYGEELYKTGTPTGEKWYQSLYEERIAFYGEAILEKYIVNGEFLREKVEQDISTALNSNEATVAYNTAYGAYLNQVAASIHGELPTEVVTEANGIIMYLTREEFSVFSPDRIDEWSFDLAFKDGNLTYQYGGDE